MNKTRVPVPIARLVCLAAAALALTGTVTRADLFVTSSGLSPQPFDAVPPATNWSVLSIAGGAGDITTSVRMDEEINTNTLVAAVTINGQMTSDGTIPPAQNATPRWNSAVAGHWLQTRTTGNKYQVLMATSRNASGLSLSGIIISYDWDQKNAIPVNESTGLEGQRVYYSLTGAAGSWIPIPEFSTFTVNSTATNLSVTLNLGTWNNGDPLYIIWVDDNGPGSTTNPQEGGYTIDNFAISLPGLPPTFSTPLVGATNAEYSVITLSGSSSGTPPITYQWSKDGTPIPGATSSSLTITNITSSGFAWSRPEDSGDYTVVATGSVAPPATSTAAHVVITADTNAPKLLWAVVDTNTVRVLLSEPVINPLDDYGNDNANLYWTVDEVGGGGQSPDLIALVGNELRLTFVSGLTIQADKSYIVTFGGVSPLTDRAQTPNNSVLPLEVPLYAHQQITVPMTQLWKYSDKDVAPPADWSTAGFDDSDTSFWKTGPGVLDAKRQATLPWCRAVPVNTLTNSVGTCLILSNDLATGATPTYYFRTHFNFIAAAPSNTALRLFSKFDDAAVVYLNGVEIDRVGVPVGTWAHNVFVGGLRSVGDGDAPDRSILLPGSALHIGDNVLAVELRQVNATSSDITMALEVTTATTTPPILPPRIQAGYDGSQVSIGWDPPGGKLVFGPTPTGPWTTNATPSNPTLVTPSEQKQFYFIAQ